MSNTLIHLPYEISGKSKLTVESFGRLLHPTNSEFQFRGGRVCRNKFLPLPVGYRVSLENDGKRYLLEIDQRDKGPLFKLLDGESGELLCEGVTRKVLARNAAKAFNISLPNDWGLLNANVCRVIVRMATDISLDDTDRNNLQRPLEDCLFPKPDRISEETKRKRQTHLQRTDGKLDLSCRTKRVGLRQMVNGIVKDETPPGKSTARATRRSKATDSTSTSSLFASSNGKRRRRKVSEGNPKATKRTRSSGLKKREKRRRIEESGKGEAERDVKVEANMEPSKNTVKSKSRAMDADYGAKCSSLVKFAEGMGVNERKSTENELNVRLDACPEEDGQSVAILNGSAVDQAGKDENNSSSAVMDENSPPLYTPSTSRHRCSETCNVGKAERQAHCPSTPPFSASIDVLEYSKVRLRFESPSQRLRGSQSARDSQYLESDEPHKAGLTLYDSDSTRRRLRAASNSDYQGAQRKRARGEGCTPLQQEELLDSDAGLCEESQSDLNCRSDMLSICYAFPSPHRSVSSARITRGLSRRTEQEADPSEPGMEDVTASVSSSSPAQRMSADGASQNNETAPQPVETQLRDVEKDGCGTEENDNKPDHNHAQHVTSQQYAETQLCEDEEEEEQEYDVSIASPIARRHRETIEVLQAFSPTQEVKSSNDESQYISFTPTQPRTGPSQDELFTPTQPRVRYSQDIFLTPTQPRTGPQQDLSFPPTQLCATQDNNDAPILSTPPPRRTAGFHCCESHSQSVYTPTQQASCPSSAPSQGDGGDNSQQVDLFAPNQPDSGAAAFDDDISPTQPVGVSAQQQHALVQSPTRTARLRGRPSLTSTQSATPSPKRECYTPSDNLSPFQVTPIHSRHPCHPDTTAAAAALTPLSISMSSDLSPLLDTPPTARARRASPSPPPTPASRFSDVYDDELDVTVAETQEMDVKDPMIDNQHLHDQRRESREFGDTLESTRTATARGVWETSHQRRQDEKPPVVVGSVPYHPKHLWRRQQDHTKKSLSLLQSFTGEKTMEKFEKMNQADDHDRDRSQNRQKQPSASASSISFPSRNGRNAFAVIMQKKEGLCASDACSSPGSLSKSALKDGINALTSSASDLPSKMNSSSPIPPSPKSRLSPSELEKMILLQQTPGSGDMGGGSRFGPCPACGKLIPFHRINEHLDACVDQPKGPNGYPSPPSTGVGAGGSPPLMDIGNSPFPHSQESDGALAQSSQLEEDVMDNTILSPQREDSQTTSKKEEDHCISTNLFDRLAPMTSDAFLQKKPHVTRLPTHFQRLSLEYDDHMWLYQWSSSSGEALQRANMEKTSLSSSALPVSSSPPPAAAACSSSDSSSETPSESVFDGFMTAGGRKLAVRANLLENIPADVLQLLSVVEEIESEAPEAETPTISAKHEKIQKEECDGSVPQYRWEGSMNYQDAGDSSVIVELTAVAEGVPLPSCSLENSEYSWCKTPKWGRWDFNYQFMQSMLQKNVRRSRAWQAVRCAVVFMRKGFLQFLRRFVIICLEDSLLHPALPILIWMNVALSKSFRGFSERHYDLCAQVVLDVTLCPYKDCLPHEEEGECLKVPTMAMVDALPVECSALVRAILVRASLGGKPGDVRMLRRYAMLWYERFAGMRPLPANILSIRDKVMRVKGFKPSNVSNELPDVPWLRLIHSVYSPKEYLQVQIQRIGPLMQNDIHSSAVDSHCSSIINDVLSNYDVKQTLQARLHTVFPRQTTPSEALKQLIWWHRASVTNKIPLDRDMSLHTTEEMDNLQRSALLWVPLKEVVETAAMRFIARHHQKM